MCFIERIQLRTNLITIVVLMAWTGLSGTAHAQWTESGSNIYYAGGHVGIGTTSPAYKLHVVGTGSRAIFGTNSSTTGTTYGVYGQVSGTSGRGVLGYASASSGTTYGLYGQSKSSSGRGVYGIATALSGETYGVYGKTCSSDGRSVFGLASATSGSTVGVWGQSNSTSGTGVFGLAPGTTAAYPVVFEAFPGATVGVRGESATVGGAGVFGWNTAESGLAWGIWGQSESPSGDGVFGYAAAATGEATGVRGEVESPDGVGVRGLALSETGVSIGILGGARSPDGIAVAGSAVATSGENFGVLGESESPDGWGVYSLGNLGASGSKLFHIDHPLDPANKYLNHFCAEGPDPLLIYRGNAELDSEGGAWVLLPEYFEAMNRDFQYQLTPIGVPAPMLHIEAEVENNRFKIGGGKPGMRVSWTVTGVRNDPFMRANTKPVEQDKPAEARGRYLHPELYGQPPERKLRVLNSASQTTYAGMVAPARTPDRQFERQIEDFDEVPCDK